VEKKIKREEAVAKEYLDENINFFTKRQTLRSQQQGRGASLPSKRNRGLKIGPSSTTYSGMGHY